MKKSNQTKYYQFMIPGLVIFLFVVLLSSCNSEKEKLPNIVLIMADDLGYGDIGCYGNAYIKTPVLDKMAGEGMKFLDYHSNGSVCTPTRAALMTGNYQQRAGLEGVIYAVKDKRIYGLGQEQKTMAEYLKDAGYQTGIFGKWHLGYKPEFNPTLHGFDEFYGYVSGNVDYISHRDGIGLYDWWHNTDTVYEEGYVTDLITNHALDFIRKNRNKPFFLYLPHEAPHYPYQGRNDKADRLPGTDFKAHGSRTDVKEAYKEMVEIMDENIGRVMDLLHELRLDKNTLVFFCSDNGATNAGSNDDLRGFKGSLWEGGHRVPAIAWFPGKIAGETENNSTILSMDILPTILALTGNPNPSKFDGKDFSKVLLNGEELPERSVCWRYRNNIAIRKGEWKYLKVKEEEFLFHLKSDVREQNNLISIEPELANLLKTELLKWELEMNQYSLFTN
jgi:arylsulfatase A-like enzyme